MAALWLARRPLTEAAVRNYFEDHGVEARYRVVEASRRRLVFDAVALGPVAQPELTARRITVDLAWLGIGPQIRAVHIDSPQLAVRLAGTGVSFGSLDRLIPPGRTDRFPPIALVVVGGTAKFATPIGRISARVDANGRFDRDFRARFRTATAQLQSGACRAAALPATITVSTKARDFAIDANGSLAAIACAAAAVPQADWSLRLAAPLTLAGLAGEISARAPAGQLGRLRFSAPLSLQLSATGSTAALHGPWQVTAGGLAAGGETARSVAAGGDFVWRRAGHVAVSGNLAARGVASGTARAAFANHALPGVAGTLADRFAAASRLADIDAGFTASGSRPKVTVSSAEMRSSSGARLRFANGGAIWTPFRTRVDGTLDLGGGGLPTAQIVLARVTRAASGWTGSGTAVVAPWRSGADMIAVPSVRFAIGDGNARIDGRVRASTNIGGGRIDGLDLRLAADVGLAGDRIILGPGCADIAADGLRFAATTARDIAVRLCPSNLTIAKSRIAGDIAIGAISLQGVTQGRAFSVASRPATLTLAGTFDRPQLRSGALAVQIGSGGMAVAATLAGTIAGDAGGWTGAGRISGLATDTAVLSVRGGIARWQLANGVLKLGNAEAVVSDRADPPRFAPLRLVDAQASLSADTMTGRGALRLAAGGAPLLTASARHDPRAGTGSARIDSNIVFGKQFQPLQITELARGLAANVDGRIVSHADLALGSGGITGTASVRFDTVSLATAALGPVTGIDGTLVFDDLPRLHTPAHQQLKIASINPGVLVENGVVEFAVVDAATIAIESMRWPFTGGTLTLRPVVLRAGETRRAFDLAVDGLDAGQFLQRFDLKNLNATGIFDGVLPLVFEGNAGRIEGGLLTARPAGGTIQYVGEVGQDSMGAAARLAFDALRRLRYRSLTLALDGDLDGEVVTAVNFAGTNEQPVRVGGSLPIRSSGLPFKFAVTVRAPFRALLGTVASFSDARSILRSAQSRPEPNPEPKPEPIPRRQP